MSFNKEIDLDKLSDKDDIFPEHVPIVPYDMQREREKEQIRKLAEEIRKKSGKYEPVVVTVDGIAKKASELTTAEQEYEFVRCAMNPVYFIETYLTIFDQTQGTAGLIVPFKLFEFQKLLIQTYRENRFVVANKYRQAGISTTTCAYIAWYIMFNENRQVAIVADKLETARDEIMSDVVLFINSCPEWLRPKTGRDTNEKNLKDTQKDKIYDNNSRLGAFSSKGLRGMTPTLIFWDETAWTEKGDKFWTAAKPTLGTGGGAIMVSTPSGLDAVFYKHFTGARKIDKETGKSENGFKAVELWWFNDPRYNKNLVWLKNKGKETEIRLTDENWSNEKRIQLMDDGWEANSPWFNEQIQGANGDMRKIAQELLCIFGDAIITVRNKKTNVIENIKIADFYCRLKEQNNSSTYLYEKGFMKKKLISKIITINIDKYRIKGGLSMFNKDYPDLIEHINASTIEMQISSMNKTLYPKLLYLKKYNGEINKITINNKVSVFDRNIGDFIEKTNNSAKKFWELAILKLNNINDFYTKTQTIELLCDCYKNYLGKSGNRKLMSDSIKLFASVYYHTKQMDSLDINLNKFSHRLYILINDIEIYCSIHNKLKHWRITNDGKFIIGCSECEPKYPSIDWFKKKYESDWEKYYLIRKTKVNENKTNSLDWFIRKYGSDGVSRYKTYVNNKMEILTTLKANKYSKISQELFWGIYNVLDDTNETYFHELNKEFVIRIPEKFNYDNTVMMIDFKHKNKIIEYNGNYWHNANKDNIRYSILKEMGYDVLVVTSDEYNRNKKSIEIIDKCHKFLTC